MARFQNIHTNEVREVGGNAMLDYASAYNWVMLPEPIAKPKPKPKPKPPATGGVVAVKPGTTAIVGEGGYFDTTVPPATGAKKK